MQKKIAESEMSEDIVESLRKYQCPENKGCNPFVDYCQCALMDSGADEIERLQEEHHDVRILNEQYYNENEILIDEIERLREALRKIAARDLQSIARRALISDDAEIWFAALNELKEYDMQAIAIDALAPNARKPNKAQILATNTYEAEGRN